VSTGEVAGDPSRVRALAHARAAVNSAKRELAYRIDAHETACPECYNREPLNPKRRDSHTTLDRAGGECARGRAPVSIPLKITRVTFPLFCSTATARAYASTKGPRLAEGGAKRGEGREGGSAIERK